MILKTPDTGSIVTQIQLTMTFDIGYSGIVSVNQFINSASCDECHL